MQQILPTVSSTKLLIIRFSKLLNFKNAQEKKTTSNDKREPIRDECKNLEPVVTRWWMFQVHAQ